MNRNDPCHPEVQLAAELRRRYSSSVYAEVFGNHHREAALRQVLQWLDTDGDGVANAVNFYQPDGLFHDVPRLQRRILRGRGSSETSA